MTTSSPTEPAPTLALWSSRRPARTRRARRTPRRAWRWGAVGLAVLVAAGGVVALLSRRAVHQLLVPPSCTVTAPSGTFTLSTSQARYAATIAAVGERDGMPDHAVSVALATALQESKLQDVDYGDRDSLGLFQQRPSEGWGTTSEIMDPVYAANAFYQALAKVPGWQDASVADAAQAVQHSADASAYTQWAGEGRALAEALTGEIPAGLACTYPASGDAHLSATVHRSALSGLPSGADATTAAVVSAAAIEELGGVLPDHPVATSRQGWQLATWLVARGQGFGMTEVSFEGWLWTARTGRWVPSTVPAAEEVTYTTAVASS